MNQMVRDKLNSNVILYEQFQFKPVFSVGVYYGKHTNITQGIMEDVILFWHILDLHHTV